MFPGDVSRLEGGRDMIRKKTVLLLAALLLLSSCERTQQAEGMSLWFPVDLDAPGHGAQAVASTKAAAADSTVESLVSGLLSGPGEDGLDRAFPEGTTLIDWSVQDGVLSLEFSEEYAALSGADRTLADYCLTLTLCQLEQVDKVCILTGDEGAEQREFSPEDVIFTGAEEEPRQISVALYFPRALGKGLGFETRVLTLTEDDDLYVMIAEALAKGPTDPDLQTYLPSSGVVLNAWVDDGVCYVNFSSDFLIHAPGEERERNLLLYSVVDTMGNLDSVEAVQILVEGDRLPEFGGVETSLPLEPDFGLLGVG